MWGIGIIVANGVTLGIVSVKATLWVSKHITDVKVDLAEVKGHVAENTEFRHRMAAG